MIQTNNNLFGIKKRKEIIEKDIKRLIQKVYSDEYALWKPKYSSALVKGLTEYTAYLNLIINYTKGKFGIEERVIGTLYKTLGELKQSIWIIKNIPNIEHTTIKKEIDELNKFINTNLRIVLDNEDRLYKE